MSVVRIDSDSTHGYQARVKLGRGRAPLTMLCSDGVHGGPINARRAANVALRLLRVRRVLIERQRIAGELKAWRSNVEVSGCLRAPMPEDAPRTAAGSPLDRPVGPVAGA